jgi:hypothetical protein
MQTFPGIAQRLPEIDAPWIGRGEERYDIPKPPTWPRMPRPVGTGPLA